MCAMSHAIREKPRWWEKINDLKVMSRWRREALKQQKPQPRHRKLTETMVRLLTMISNDDHRGTIVQQVDYVLDELHGFAVLRDEETGIEVSVRSVSSLVASNPLDPGT